AQVLQLPERLPVGGRGQQGLLDQAQVGEERAASRVGQVSLTHPGSEQAFGKEKQEGAIRLLGGACPELREEFGVRRLGGLQRQGEVRAGRGGSGRECQAA